MIAPRTRNGATMWLKSGVNKEGKKLQGLP